MTSARKLPESIRLSTLDLSFLIPETEDMEGLYFPMSVACCFPLKRPVKVEELLAAICQLDQRFPQFRLGYSLDYAHNRLVRVPEGQLENYWASCIKMRESSLDVPEKLAEAVSTNNVPFYKPIMFYVDDRHLVVKMHHSMGDGRYYGHMVGYLLLAIADPIAFQKLPALPMNFGLPVRKLIFQTPRQGLRILSGAIKSFASYYKDSQPNASVQEPTAELTPIVTGSPMAVECVLIQPDVMKRLNNLKIALSGDAKITLNSLLQVLIAFRLAELGLTSLAPEYAIIVDLRRYLKNPREFYPGNLNSQIKVKSSDWAHRNLQTECAEIQQQADTLLEKYEPLLMAPGESVLGLFTRAYKNINRKWLLASIKIGPRFFVFSNLGHLDNLTRPISSLLDTSQGLFSATPLMGGIPLVFNFSMIAGRGNLTMTYDPRVLSKEQVQAVAGMFDTDWIAAQFPADSVPVPAQLEAQEA